MDVSIIICTYNRCKSLKSTLESITNVPVSEPQTVEIVVVDNNSRDATAAVVADFAAVSPVCVRYVVETEQGLSFARNRGIREASGEVLVFADDDVIVSPVWVDSIRSTFADPTVSCAGGKIIPLWEKRCPRWLTPDLHGYLALLDLGDRKLRMTEPRLWGANLAFRASVFATYGRFDTSLGRTAGKLYGNEEVDLVKKLIDHGEGVFYVPEMMVHHCIGANRMKKSYFRKWMFDGGELEGLQMGHYPHRNLFGIPYYMVKEAVKSAVRCLAGSAARRKKRFLRELAFARMAGLIQGRVKVHRALRLPVAVPETTPGCWILDPPGPRSLIPSAQWSTMTNTAEDKILIISPMIPRPDRNSGDLRLASMIGVLAATYGIVFVSTSYRPGDDPYIEAMERLGVTVHAERFSLLKLLDSTRFRFAIIEFYFMAEHYLDRIRLRQPECLVVVDSVDLHYLRIKLKYSLTREAADEAAYRETRAREVAVYRKADAVITVTDADSAALLEEYPDISCEVVPNIHELFLKNPPAEGDGLIFVGGFNHDPNVDAVLYFCAEILPLIRKKKPGVTFTVVGGNPPGEILRLADESVRVTGHVPETSSYLHGSRVSVAPLRYGAGMKGKIGEAMAHGVPVVTTSIGAQGMGLTNRKDIMISDSPQAFAGAVIELLDDRQLHETIRKNAARMIEERYTPRQVARVMLAALERIGGKSARRMTLPGKISFYNGYITNWVKSRLSSG